MTTAIWTADAEKRLVDYLATHNLSEGVGSVESACSVAAINLALDGKLTDEIPECMSDVLGEWIKGMQDAMPFRSRNSHEWKALVPLAAGTGREHEGERLAVIIAYMWETLSLLLQLIADKHGFGAEWQAMCSERTSDAAYAASDAAYAADCANSTDDLDSVYQAAEIAAGVVEEGKFPPFAAGGAARAVIEAAEIAEVATDKVQKVWSQINPSAALARIIHLEHNEGK